MIAHGAGLSVIVPAWIKYVWSLNPEQFQRWAENVWSADTVESAIEK